MKRLMLVVTALAVLGAAPPAERVLVLRTVLRGHEGRLVDGAFSSDGKLLATCAIRERVKGKESREKRWGDVKVWDVQTGKAKATWVVEEGEPSSVVFLPGGKALFCRTTEEDRLIRWDVGTGKKIQVMSLDSPRSAGRLSISLDGKRIGQSGRCVTVWDTTTGKKIGECKWEGSTTGVLSHDLSIVAVANYQDVDFYDVKTGKLLRSYLDHPGSGYRPSFSADDRLLAFGYTYRDGDRDRDAVGIWDLRRNAKVRTIKAVGLNAVSVELSPKGDLLAAFDSFGRLRVTAEVRLYETTSGGELARLQPLPIGEWVTQARFSPDGRLLALACSDNSVRLYEVRLPRQKR